MSIGLENIKSRRYLFLLIIAGFVIAGAVIGLRAVLLRGENAANQQQIALGEQIYQENCAACHGVNGEGEYPAAPLEPDPDGLMGAPPHNEAGHTWHHDDSLLIETITSGSSYPGFKPMPAFGDQLSDWEILAVLAFLKTMWTDEQRDIQREVSTETSGFDVPTIRELADDE